MGGRRCQRPLKQKEKKAPIGAPGRIQYLKVAEGTGLGANLLLIFLYNYNGLSVKKTFDNTFFSIGAKIEPEAYVSDIRWADKFIDVHLLIVG